MARDDYFAIVYKLLRYLYSCFKAGEAPDMDMMDAAALGINEGYWGNIIESLNEDGYIKGVSILQRVGSPAGIKFTDLKITPKGIEYLEESSMMHKAKEAAKEAVKGAAGAVVGKLL